MNYISILIVVLSYCIGSVSIAILICKILHYPDPRNFGSKNPGTTNILRIAGYNIAIIVLILDILKGVIPVWISIYYFNVSSSYLNAIVISVCLGHMYPLFFKFHGGKGVATAFGAITIMGTDLFAIMSITWVLTVLLFKYSSLAAIVTAITISFYTWYFQPQYFLPIIIISFLVIIKHIHNIQRLWHHEEHHIFKSLKNK